MGKFLRLRPLFKINNITRKILLYKAIIRAAMLYGAEIWGPAVKCNLISTKYKQPKTRYYTKYFNQGEVQPPQNFMILQTSRLYWTKLKKQTKDSTR
ncbi:hypothetical protein PR048_004614 [Dryococelus australis]|uniref:Uncharacterized protein n=1 Tax=Dryococelus australis TaxID=614101 RepID=A0ABQ9I5W5_9NEOP|nr:hypothetical protein PR048_004614 [Dryococelus australis]